MVYLLVHEVYKNRVEAKKTFLTVEAQKRGCHQLLIFFYLHDCYSPQELKFTSVSKPRFILVTPLKLAECDQSLPHVIQD